MSKLKIAIIGGGWVGCHLANKLRTQHQVTLFEKNDRLVAETSYNNQNRLHLGYHYARNYLTRNLCATTFDRFLVDYEFLTKEVSTNLYCIPIKNSILDLTTYKQIFQLTETSLHHLQLSGIEGCIDTGERFIDFEQVSNFFNNQLHDITINKTISPEDVDDLCGCYDLVINATNNYIEDRTLLDTLYELTVSFVYKEKEVLPFGALTLVDGPLFSIYPYRDGFYTLTDVEYTSLNKFTDTHQMQEYVKNLPQQVIQDRQTKSEEKVLKYFPEFEKYLEYSSYFLSVKVKSEDTTANRYPSITQQGNLINCSTGKIQGIYVIEDYINNEINNRI